MVGPADKNAAAADAEKAKKPAERGPEGNIQAIEEAIDGLHRAEARAVHALNVKYDSSGSISSLKQFRPDLQNTHLIKTNEIYNEGRKQLLAAIDPAQHAEANKIYDRLQNHHLYTQCNNWSKKEFGKDSWDAGFKELQEFVKTAQAAPGKDDQLKKVANDTNNLSKQAYNKALDEARAVLSRQHELDMQLAYQMQFGYTNREGQPAKEIMRRLDAKEEHINYVNPDHLASISTKLPGKNFESGIWGVGKDRFIITDDGVRPENNSSAGVLFSRGFERAYSTAIDMALMRKGGNDNKITINFDNAKDGDFHTIKALFRVARKKGVGIDQDGSKNLLMAIELLREGFRGDKRADELLLELKDINARAETKVAQMRQLEYHIEKDNKSDLTTALHEDVEKAHELETKASKITNSEDDAAVDQAFKEIRSDVDAEMKKVDPKEAQAEQQIRSLQRCVNVVASKAEQMLKSPATRETAYNEVKAWVDNTRNTLKDKVKEVQGESDKKRGVIEMNPAPPPPPLRDEKFEKRIDNIVSSGFKGVDKPDAKPDEKCAALEAAKKELLEEHKEIMKEPASNEKAAKLGKIADSVSLLENKARAEAGQASSVTYPPYKSFIETTVLEQEEIHKQAIEAKNVVSLQGGVEEVKREGKQQPDADGAINEIKEEKGHEVRINIEAQQGAEKGAEKVEEKAEEKAQEKENVEEIVPPVVHEDDQPDDPVIHEDDNPDDAPHLGL